MPRRDVWLTYVDIRRIYGIPERTLCRLVRTGRLKPPRYVNGFAAYRAIDIQAIHHIREDLGGFDRMPWTRRRPGT